MINLRFTKEHEWIRIEGKIGTIGITNFAQEQLGDIVYVELPDIGEQFKQADQAAVIESVKAASEVFSPVTGKIIETNTVLIDSPEIVNTKAETGGWFFKLEIFDPSELEELMDTTGYKNFIA